MNIVKLSRRKGFNRIFLGFGIILLVFLTYLCMEESEQRRMTDIFKEECIIESVDDIEVCKNKSYYVKVRFDDAYDTSYVYLENNKEVANYIDIDMDGYSLIALVDKETTQKIFNNEQFYVTGYITDFTTNKVHNNALNHIKDYYKDELFEGEYSSTEINEFFLNTEIMAFNTGKFYYYVLWGIVLVGIYHVVRGIFISTSLKSTKWYQKYKDMLEEIETKDIICKKRNIMIIGPYIIENNFLRLKIEKLEDGVLIYRRNIKKYGVTVNSSWVVGFKTGTTMLVPTNIDIQTYISKDALMGYTYENLKLYKNIVKTYKQEN